MSHGGIVLIGHNLQRVTDTGWHKQRQAIHVNVILVSREYVKDVYPVSFISRIFFLAPFFSFLFSSVLLLVKIYITLISSTHFWVFFVHILLRSPRLVLLISCSSHTSARRLENALFSTTQETQSISFTKKCINSCAQPEKGKKIPRQNARPSTSRAYR